MSRRGCFGTGRDRAADEVIEGMREVAPAIPPQPRHFFAKHRFGPAYPDGSYVIGYFEIGGGYGRVERVAYVTASMLNNVGVQS